MTALRYEELVALVLDEAHVQSEQCALMALEEPLQACDAWTPLDLVVMADCHQAPKYTILTP